VGLLHKHGLGSVAVRVQMRAVDMLQRVEGVVVVLLLVVVLTVT